MACEEVRVVVYCGKRAQPGQGTGGGDAHYAVPARGQVADSAVGDGAEQPETGCS